MPRHIVVLGLGESGAAAARLGRLYGREVTILESAASPVHVERADQLRTMDVRVCLEWSGEIPENADLAVVSPGVPTEAKMMQACRRARIPVISELEFGYRCCACPIVAVTGTNGKTTTVELLVHCLRKAGYAVRAAGNIGIPLSAQARRSHLLDFLVVEASSFQLEHVDRFAPVAAAILNVTEDHLDRHRSVTDYLEAKLRVLQHLPDARRAVLRYDLATNACVRKRLPPGIPTSFAGCDNGVSTYVVSAHGQIRRRERGGAMQTIGELHGQIVEGRHNVENALAALALAEAAGVDPKVVAAHIESFAVGEHRLETVAVSNGIRFVNDSKATNPDALRHALETLSAQNGRPNILLIAGGMDKNSSFDGLADVLQARVKGVFLIGSSRAKLAQDWGGAVSCRTYISLRAAFDAAAEEAVAGDIVLLSPACSSHDMFDDYAHRGSTFRQLVERRLGE